MPTPQEKLKQLLAIQANPTLATFQFIEEMRTEMEAKIEEMTTEYNEMMEKMEMKMERRMEEIKPETPTDFEVAERITKNILKKVRGKDGEQGEKGEKGESIIGPMGLIGPKGDNG